MKRLVFLCVAFLSVFSLHGLAQTAENQEKPVSKFELRPSSRDYAPVRRGNSFQPGIRVKQPTIRSQQMQSANKKISRIDRKAKRRANASARKMRTRRLTNK